MIKTLLHGNWVDLDKRGKFTIDEKDLVCPRCGKPPVYIDGVGYVDACIGKKIDGVKSICCGHGVRDGFKMLNKQERMRVMAGYEGYGKAQISKELEDALNENVALKAENERLREGLKLLKELMQIAKEGGAMGLRTDEWIGELLIIATKALERM